MIAGPGLRASISVAAFVIVVSAGFAREQVSPTPEPTASAAAQLAKDCGLRFDGVYVFTERSFAGGMSLGTWILRFYEDGSVIPPTRGLSRTEMLRKMAHGEKLPLGTYQLRRVSSVHHSCDIDIQVGSQSVSGSTKPGTVILRGRGMASLDELTPRYEFEPVDYQKILEQEKAAEVERREILRRRAEDAAAKTTVRLGAATMNDGCSAVEFTAGPARLPPQSRSLAYEVSGTSEYTTVEIEGLIGALCPAGNVATRTCQVIRRGQPLPFVWTAVVSCGGEAPFRPGGYQLKVFTEGLLAKTIPFTVAGAARRKAPSKAATTPRPRS